MAQVPDLTNGEARTDDKTWNLGPTGMSGWLYRPDWTHKYDGWNTEFSRQIEVMVVDTGSPADGVLQVGDVILGADGTGADPVAFTSNAQKAFADGIAEAEANSPATLKLLVWRAGNTSTMSITLETLGAYSATAPYNCPKSAAVLEKGLDAVMASGAKDNWNFSLLALLAGNDPANPDNAARMVRAQQEAHALILPPEEIARFTSGISLPDSKIAWNLGFQLIAIAEYYLQTGDSAVYDSMEAYAIAYANGQSMFGTGGHQFSQMGADGSVNGPYGVGYGVVNSANMQCFLGLTLAKEAGVTDQKVLDAIERAATFYGGYVDLGTIPYGEHTPGTTHGDNGKSGIAALCFKMVGTRNYDANYYAKLAGSSAYNLDAGHQGPYLNYLWTPLGANAGGEESMAAFFVEQRWRFDLARNWDGTFTYNTYSNGGQGGNGGDQWSSVGFRMYQTMLLPYATPLRQTYTTGKGFNSSDDLTSAEVDEVTFAVDYDPTTRSTSELMADLGLWSPVIRKVVAEEIGTRTADHASLLPTLHATAVDTNASISARIGACFALGEIADDTSVPVLVSLLTDAEHTVRWAAASNFQDFSDAAKLAEVNAMLTAVASASKPLLPLDAEDPLHLAQGQLVYTLFYSGGVLNGPEIDAIDRNLLLPAIQAAAEHPQGHTRGALNGIYPRLSREDIEGIAQAVVSATIDEAPADRMFSGAVREAGLNVLYSHNFAEGVPLAKLLTPEHTALDILQNYAASSLSVMPDPKIEEFCEILIASNNNPEAAQSVIDAIAADTNPETLTSFKRIYWIEPSKASLTLPEDWMTLRVDAHDFALGDSVYTWRKVYGAGEVSFTPNGTAAKETTVRFDGTPGQYLFEVTMSDSLGLTEVTKTIAYTLYDTGGTLPANTAPTANPQSLTVNQGAPTSFQLWGTDPEGSPLTYTVISGPEHGSLTGTAPNMVYTAAANYTGSDSITYEVMDSEGQVDSTIVVITVNAATPVGLAVYEPFDYPVAVLDGVSGSSEIGLDGAWTAGTLIEVKEPGFDYGTLPTKGNMMFGNGINAPGAYRPINPAALAGNGLLDDGATLWFSVIIGFDTTNWTKAIHIALANSSASYGPQILDDGVNPGSGVGVSMDGQEIYAAHYRDTASGPVYGAFDSSVAGVMLPDVPRLIVGKFTWGATEDTIEIYLPGEDMILPDQPTSTVTADVDQATFDTFTFSRPNDVGIDEVRFGATLHSVLQGTVAMTSDTTPPNPDPMSFAVAPTVSGSDSITMTASPAYDPLGVEYYFSCTAGGGNNSGWQASNVYTDTGLTPSVQYSYTVKARDKQPGLNETTVSAAASATIPSLGTAPDVVGMLQSTAEAFIVEANLVVGTITSAGSYSLSVPAGYVLSQSPSANGNASYGSAVDLVISIGQAPALPSLDPVDIVDDQDGGPVVQPLTITYTLTFSKDMDASTIDAGDFVNLADIPIIIGAINEVSPGVVTVEVTPNSIDSGFLIFAIAQGAALKDAQGNDLNTTYAISDDQGMRIRHPDNWAPVVDAGADQTVTEQTSQPWSPALMATTAWFDASDTNTITLNGGNVSQWADKSGNDNHASQGNSDRQPAYHASDAGLNDLPTIGSNGFKYLDTPNIAAIRNAYIVTYYDDPDDIFDSWRTLFSDTANTAKLQATSNNSGWVSGIGFDKYKNGATTSSDANILPMGPTIWTAKGTASHANKNWRILAGIQNYQYWEYGAVGEVILTDGTEDLATQQQIEGYLAHKWGTVGDLDAAHPYKLAAPRVLAWAASLDATAVDYDNDPFDFTWSLLSGPAGFGVADASDVDITAIFTAAGTYVLELVADDGTAVGSDQVTVTVQDVVDTTPPTLAATSIMDDRGGLPVIEGALVTYTVMFSEDIDAATVDASDFSNAGTSSVTIGSIVKATTGVFIVEATPTDAGTLALEVSAGATLADLVGNVLDTTTAIVDDTTITVLAPPSGDDVSILIDLSNASEVTNPAGDGKNWNVLGQADGALDDSLAALLDSSNLSTTIGLAIDLTNIDASGTSGAGFGGTGINGPPGADPFDEAAVITDGIFNNVASNGTAVFIFTGLAGDTSYTFSAIGGRASDGDDGQIIILDAATPLGAGAVTTETTHTLLNDGTVLDFSVTSNASGEIFFEFRKANPADTDGSATINALSMTGTVYYETTPPTLASADIVDDQGGANVTDNDVVTYTVTFSEDIDHTTVDAADFSNAGTSAITMGTITETSPGVFSVEVTPTTVGTLQLQLSATAVLTDVIGNALYTNSAIADDTTITVDETNLAPVWTSNPLNKADATEDAAYNGTLENDASDGNAGDTLTFAKVSGPAWLYVTTDGKFFGQPSNADVGANVFSVSVSDGAAAPVAATLNITVTNTNDAPFFASNPVTGSDASEDVAYAGTLAGTASDDDAGATLTYAKLSGPDWLSVAANGALTGTPTISDVGANSFTVSVTDSIIATPIEATLSITVVNTNDAPVFAVDPIAGSDATEDAAYSGTLAGSASDVDVGATLTYAKVDGPAWLSIASDGTLSGTPANGDVGANSFTVSVTDSIIPTPIQATLNITVVNTNDAPAFASNPVVGSDATEDAAYSGTLAGSASDADVGATLTYAKVDGPVWLSIASDGTLSGTPVNGDVGAESFTVSVTDGIIATPIEATLNITVVNTNDAPVFASNPIAGSDATKDIAYAGTLAGSATDEDTGDTLAYAKVSGPSWLSVGTDGTLSGTPANGDLGANAFTVSVSDGTVVPIEATLNITVRNTNNVPVVDAGADKTIYLISEAQPWTPAETTTALWLDADDASTFTLNGGNVEEWRDKSGNSRHAGQAATNSQPANTASGLDGKHVVTFDGSSDYLNFGTGLDFMSGASHSAFIVLADVTNYTDIYGAASGGSGANSLHVGFSNSSSYRMNYWGHDYGPSVTGNFVASGSILNYVWDVGSPKQIFANGSLEGSGHNANAPGTMSGGGRISNVVGHGYLGGKIAEIVIVSGSVSQADRECLEGYLAHKWGMEGNLPGGHPYKSAPPGGAGMSAVANLSDATASDPDGDDLTTDWDLSDGPGASVTFGDEAALNTTATFTQEGVYKLHLTGDDTRDQTTDEVIITVDIAGLSVAIDQGTMSEDGGSSSVTLTRVVTTGDLVVNLSSDDGSEATVPASVTILDGNATANFTVTAQNDSLDDGTQTVTITATASGYPDATDTVDVLDDEYLVSYNGNGNDGGTAPADGSNPYSSGSTVIVSDSGTLTLTGYHLSEWTTEAGGGGTSYSPGNTFAISGDITLYAQWAANNAPSFTVDPIAGSNATEDAAYTGTIAGSASDDDVGATLTYAKVDGPAWLSIASNGTLSGTPTNSDVGANSFTVSVTDGIIATPIEATLELTVLNTYTVSFNGNGSDGGSPPSSQVKTQGVDLTLSAASSNGMTRAGYSFSGWNTASNGGGTSYADGGTYTANAADILYAQWTANTYTVAYHGNISTGGSAPSDQTKTHAIDLTLATKGSLEKTGHTFSGWNTAADGTGDSYASEATYSANSATTLYAQWSPSSYTVTFDANGGGAPSPASKSVTYNTTYGTLAAISHTGYTFMGWFTSGVGGAEITSGTTVAITAAQTLYAQWNEKPVVNAGSEQSVYMIAKDVDWAPADAAASLTGWYDASDSDNVVLSGQNVTNWKDISGNGYDLDQSPTDPVYDGSQINGLNVIHFADTWAELYR
ncbi:MAG: InlB B-repeat-containing protein, partial [Verrucomicrobiae bacterium]|nr:InlB B-repeat-containing protein [Verrucomicrobiae bacterium]NNJ44034.1 tandem-95 repeat protein [Akkermansiaceae bacterium]